MTNAIEKLQPVTDTREVFLDSKATGKAVKNARAGAKIMQKELAAEMAVTPSYLSDLERGARRWTTALFDKAKAALQQLAR